MRTRNMELMNNKFFTVAWRKVVKGQGLSLSPPFSYTGVYVVAKLQFIYWTLAVNLTF